MNHVGVKDQKLQYSFDKCVLYSWSVQSINYWNAAYAMECKISYSCHIQNTVSVNASGKERLILDLRHIDQFIENRKYKFEGVPENLHCVINTTRILVISTFLYTRIISHIKVSRGNIKTGSKL